MVEFKKVSRDNGYCTFEQFLCAGLGVLGEDQGSIQGNIRDRRQLASYHGHRQLRSVSFIVGSVGDPDPEFIFLGLPDPDPKF
jgi:hypothetical protein